MTTQTATKTYRFKEAVARYGQEEYPLNSGDFPEEPSFNQVREGLKKQFPGDERTDRLVITMRDRISGLCSAAIVIHFPDFSVYVEYEEA